jgi:hypothetical protein
MSKVLEIWVKADLEAHLAAVNGLPQTQFGFRPKRSCATALSHAQAGWLHGVKAGKVVWVMEFDLSATFDTLSHLQLLPKLSLTGITGRPLAWFKSYLTGGHQQVESDGARSNFVDVKFGVRQGSILGPLLFLVHVGDMQEYLGIRNDYKVVYADDTCLWCYAMSLPAAIAKLNSLASRFSAFARESGLALNAGKMQLLFSAGSGNVNAAVATVDRKKIVAKETIELREVKFDRRFCTAEHEKALVAAVRQRASVIKRLSDHLPCR